jgi:hypothetical protein
MDLLSKIFYSSELNKANIKNELNIMDAVNAHIQWKIRLEKYINGTSEEVLDPKVVCRDDLCKLGKWIHDSGVNHFQDDEELIILREHHAQFHLVAGEVVAKVQMNDKEAARALMKVEYMAASRNVVHDLTALNKQLQR